MQDAVMEYRRIAAIAACVLSAGAGAQQPEAAGTLPEVRVIQRTPLPGFELPRSLYPGHAQQASDLEIERAGAGTLPEFMNRRLPGVTVNEVQGSPYQLDLNYRGQRLSPLLGSPQGLSLWLDGVRMNQPFGDVVSWDLLPEAALAGLTLVPGSNPLYGLNTLGGALVLTTKSGSSHPGTHGELSLGEAGRKRLSFGHGWRWGDGWHGYVAVTGFEEHGWRDQSDGTLANLYAKVGRQQGEDGWTLSLLHAGSRLNGNGLVGEQLAAQRWAAVYTAPDTTRSRDTLLAFQDVRTLAGGGRLTLQAWHRQGQRDGRNGDVGEDWEEWLEECEDDPEAAECTDPSDPEFVSARAVINRTHARQRETGAGLQWSQRSGAHQWLVGADAAVAHTEHDQYAQPATFDLARTATALGAGDGEHEVSLRGRARRIGLFVSDLFELGPGTQLSGSLRWDATRVSNDLGQPLPRTSESFRYSKLNPAVGITHALSPRATLFASASQGTRVPTSLELGCADPLQPCVLPTGLQADPYLKQVVARTLEVGARMRASPGVEFSGALFRTDSRDDILFLQSGVAQAGYFANVDRTRRQGLELAAQGRSPRVDWQVSYTWLDATYRSEQVLPGPLSTEDQPNTVRRGSPIAGLPGHVLKLSADWRFQPRWSVGADVLAFGSQAVAGNEGGNHPELGRLGGYTVVHARLRWQFRDGWHAWLRVHNLFDRRYATYAAGNLDFFPGGVALRPGMEPAAARFIAPGAPRMAGVGVGYEWD